MNTEETVRTDAVINVTTTKLVIHSLEIVAGALTVIVMQNAIKNATVELTAKTVRTNVGNVLMI